MRLAFEVFQEKSRLKALQQNIGGLGDAQVQTAQTT
jgi:hypothetical protein